jgi:hypothetical protein
MFQIRRPAMPAEDVAIDAASHAGEGWSGRIAAVVSTVALAFSGYGLWETSLKAPDVRVFVAPVIHYASPYNNSNFEMISLPVTLTNEGARTGTVLAMELAVTEGEGKPTKRFYAADLGRWSMERTRAMSYQPFAPMALAGRTSRTENILFYPKGDGEVPQQVVREATDVRFVLTVDLAEVDDWGFLDRLWKRSEPKVAFTRRLRFYDARAFQNGTIPMDAKDWKTSTNAP